MPLYDHFRPPLSVRRHWHAFHNAWATFLASHLNQFLPEDLHQELLMRVDSPAEVPWEADLYAVAYRLVERAEQPSLDIWQHSLHLGQPLPTLPLWLRGNICLGVDLENTYSRTCHEQRISAAIS